MNAKLKQRLAGILFGIGVLCVVSGMVSAEDFNFAGTWKGEYSPAAGAPATAGRGVPGGNNATQKVTLRVKVNKDKATGNFSMGSADAEDIREAKIDGNKLSFKTGLAPAPTYDYEAVIIGDALSVTRTSSGGKGGRPQQFTLMRNK